MRGGAAARAIQQRWRAHYRRFAAAALRYDTPHADMPRCHAVLMPPCYYALRHAADCCHIAAMMSRADADTLRAAMPRLRQRLPIFVADATITIIVAIISLIICRHASLLPLRRFMAPLDYAILLPLLFSRAAIISPFSLLLRYAMLMLTLFVTIDDTICYALEREYMPRHADVTFIEARRQKGIVAAVIIDALFSPLF